MRENEARNERFPVSPAAETEGELIRRLLKAFPALDKRGVRRHLAAMLSEHSARVRAAALDLVAHDAKTPAETSHRPVGAADREAVHQLPRFS